MGRLRCAMQSALKANSGSLELAFLLCLADARRAESAGCWNCKHGQSDVTGTTAKQCCFQHMVPMSLHAAPHTAVCAQQSRTRRPLRPSASDPVCYTCVHCYRTADDICSGQQHAPVCSMSPSHI